jgi:hypothetical protein
VAVAVDGRQGEQEMLEPQAHRTNALDSSSRRIGGSGRFGYTGNIRAYGIDNREAGRRGRGRGRGSFGGGNQNEREVSPGVGQGQSST